MIPKSSNIRQKEDNEDSTSLRTSENSSVSHLETALLEAHRIISDLNKSGSYHSDDSDQVISDKISTGKMKLVEFSDWIQHNEKLIEDLSDAKKERSELQEKLFLAHKRLDQLRIVVTKLKTQVYEQIELIGEEIKSVEELTGFPGEKLGHQKTLSQKGLEKESIKKKGKVFVPRESLLTGMLEIRDFRTVYNIFVAILLVLSCSLLWQNYLDGQSIIDFSTFKYAFGKIDLAIKAWGVMFIYACTSHYVWYHAGLKWNPNAMIYVYFTVQLCFLLSVGYYCLSNNLPTASGFIVTLEACRLAMKVHSFFRSILSLVWSMGKDDWKKAYGGHTFESYLYFLFAPTILYRKSYPRTPYIRWTFVFARFVEVCMVILYTYVILVKYGFPQVRSAAQKPDSLKFFVISIFNSMIPGISIFVFCFFGLLHSWLNMWAELLRFADRQFYKDWWNANSFGEFYRTWNTPVHDWLYNYVYLDMLEYFDKKNYKQSTSKFLSALFVIEFSAVVHEYAISCATGFFLPVLMFMFGGPGVFFSFMNPKRNQAQGHNIFFWAMMFIGHGLILMLYTREYYVRYSIANETNMFTLQYWIQFITPYSWLHFLQ